MKTRMLDVDPPPVHTDSTALLMAWVLRRSDAGQLEFPYDAVKVKFLVQAA